MPVIKSAIKRVKTNEKKRSHNITVKSEMRTAIKNFEKKVEEKDVENAKEAFVEAEKNLDKAARKGIIHKNKAARRKSRLEKKLNELSA
jgi:small subunit ribosomal protein S20